jgi:hypothetical protein
MPQQYHNETMSLVCIGRSLAPCRLADLDSPPRDRSAIEIGIEIHYKNAADRSRAVNAGRQGLSGDSGRFDGSWNVRPTYIGFDQGTS